MPDRWEADGLSARRLDVEDLPHVDAMHTDDRSMAPIGGTRTPEHSAAYLDAALKHWDTFGFGMYLLFDDGRLAGRAGIKRDGADLELAYILLPEWWGRGLATAVVRCLLTMCAASEIDARRVVAYTRHDNLASRRVMEKVGLDYAGEVERGGHPCVRYSSPLENVRGGSPAPISSQ